MEKHFIEDEEEDEEEGEDEDDETTKDKWDPCSFCNNQRKKCTCK